MKGCSTLKRRYDLGGDRGKFFDSSITVLAAVNKRKRLLQTVNSKLFTNYVVFSGSFLNVEIMFSYLFAVTIVHINTPLLVLSFTMRLFSHNINASYYTLFNFAFATTGKASTAININM